MKRRGFTLIELMAVIAIIGVLITITIVAAGGAIRNARDQRAETMRVALEQAINSFHAQDPNSRWPDTIENRTNEEYDRIEFTGTDADAIFRQVVGKGFGKSGPKSMLVDASALFVCDAGRAGNSNATGLDFPIAANRNSKDCIPFASMAFGYQESSRGKFRRFKVVYSMKTDSVTVER